MLIDFLDSRQMFADFRREQKRKIFFYSAYIFSDSNEKYFSFAMQPIETIDSGVKNIFRLHGGQNDDPLPPATGQKEEAAPASAISTPRTCRHEMP